MQPKCNVTQVDVLQTTGWQVVESASNAAILDAAVRLVIKGGDDRTAVAINLQTDEDLRSDVDDRFAPTASFDEFVVVDRDEIEGYRSIQHLMSDYLRNEASARPLSIAVFGPPGSGKSYGVKSVARFVSQNIEGKGRGGTSFLEFNLSQFLTPKELESAFFEIINEGTQGKVPVVFFDEFDSRLGSEELGWLRYFLAPMQDGEFWNQGKKQKIGKAVFVFAGGTSENFRDFAREGAKDDERIQFVNRKGPDFVSRLSGHIDVIGINQKETGSDNSFVLRRALLVRSELRRRNLIGRNGRSILDVDFLVKLLKVERFKHGARSLGKVLDMCVGEDGALHPPPREQLMMHVEKKDSEDLLSVSF